MTRRTLSLVVRASMVLLAGLIFGLLAAVASSFAGGGVAHAAVAPTCSIMSGVAQVNLGDGTTTLSKTSGGSPTLQVNGVSCGAFSSITSISFVGTVATAVPTGVVLDQAAGGTFPCMPINGSLPNVPLQVAANTGESLVFGTSGANLNGCTGSGQVVSPTGVTVLSASAAAGPVTISGTGGGITGSALAAPVGFAASPNTSGTAYTLGGNVNLQASAGSYTVAPTASGNVITGGSGTESFTVSGTNPVAFVGSAGGTYTIAGLVSSSQVTGGSGTESFTFSGSNPLSVVGTAGGTYTVAGLVSSSHVTAGPGAETFSITGPVTSISVNGGTDNTGNDAFTVTGNGNKNNTLSGGSGTTSFNLPGTGNDSNTLVGGSGPTAFTLTGSSTTYNGKSGTDTVTITGSSNTFNVGSGSETFYNTGSPNTVNFGAVGASPGSPLVVNDAGNSEAGLSNGQATLGGTAATYTFRDSPTTQTSLNFTTFIGASGGSTHFLAGGSGGVSFDGQGRGNAASFFGSNGVVANVSGALQITNAQLGSTLSPLSGFQIGSGQVLVASPGGNSSCSGTPVASFCDLLTDIYSVTGPSGGYSTFYAGPAVTAPDSYVFSDSGDFNTFIGGTGPATFSSSGNNNTFVAGFGNETFTETTPSQVPRNTIDFSNVPVGTQPGCTSAPCTLTVNVSGAGATVPNFAAELTNTALASLATYTFGGSGGGVNFTTFIGATGGNTVFLGGSGSYTYTGKGIGNTLDFSNVPSATATTLTFDVTHPPLPQAQLGSVPETFSGVTNLVGLATGSTTFVGGSTGGYTFNGRGSANQAVFTTQGPSTNLTVQVTPVTSGTVTFAIPGGQTLCADVPVSPTGLASCYPTSLPSGQIQVVATYTPPNRATFTGSGVVLSVANGAGPTPTTTTVGTIGGPLFQGQPVTLSAGVVIAGTSTAVTSGNVAFFLAGRPGTLCSYSLPSTSCSAPSLPAGNYTLLAVYTPGSGFGGSAGTAAISVSAPPSSSVSLSGFVFTFPATFTVSYSVPTGSGGVVCISTPDPFVSFSTPPCTAVSGTGSFSAGIYFLSQNDTVTAQLSYSSGIPFSGSAATTGPLTGAVNYDGYQQTTTSLSASVNGITVTSTTAGTTVTLTATVQASTVPGGTISFQLADGTPLCSNVPVPSGGASATIFCSAPFQAGLDNIVATYSPPCCSFAGSAVVFVLTVNGPTSSTSTAGFTPVTDPQGGVVVNLSASPYSTNGLYFPPVSVLANQVLVAAPSSAVTSCAGTPIPTFCDALVNISNVTGSGLGHNVFVAGASSEFFTDPGPVGGDTLDLSRVQTGSTASALSVNVTGGSGSYVATVNSGPTYNFAGSGGGPNFTTFIGSTQGFTTFLAGPTPGYTFTANGSFNSLDYSAGSAGPVIVNLSGSTLDGTVSVGAGTDFIHNLPSVVGSSQGGNLFRGGAAPGVTYNFTGPGSGNRFVAGTGPDSFTGTGSNNVVDFSALPSTDFVTVNRSSGLTSPSPNTAQGSNLATYSFSAVAMTFVGSPAGTIFYAGTLLDTFVGAVSPATRNELSFHYASGTPLSISLVSPPTSGMCSGVASAGQATLNGGNQPFCNISVFDGLPGGASTFVANDATSGYTFNAAPGTAGNVADFSAAIHPVKIDLSSTSNNVTFCYTPVPCGTDTVTGVTSVTGSAAGHNLFVAGTTSEQFIDPCTATGCVPKGDTIDFSHVPTGSLTSALTVNVTGGSGTYVASVGSGGPTYTFGGSFGGPNFTSLIGSAQGYTAFLAGPSPGYTFTAAAGTPSNSVDFAAAGPVTVDLSGSTLDGTVAVGGGTDFIHNLAAVAGSSQGGNVFRGGSAPVTYSFNGPGNGNRFIAGTSSDAFAGTGSNNVVDFSALPNSDPVTVNVSSGLTSPAQNTAQGINLATYSFSAVAMTFVGSPGGTIFYAGTLLDTFVGVPSALVHNELSFHYASGTPLSINLVSPPTSGMCSGVASAGQATLNGGNQPFCNISTFDGLPGGASTFLASDATSGYTFIAAPGTSGNVADFSAAAKAVKIDLSSTTNNVTFCYSSTPCGIDTITGVASVYGSANVVPAAPGATIGNDFIVGPSGASLGDLGSAAGDIVDFTHVVGTTSTNPLTINASGKLDVLSPYTATFGTTTWTFAAGGVNFTKFVGALGGNTVFLASGVSTGVTSVSGGFTPFTFVAQGGGNTLDLSTNTTGVTVDMRAGSVQLTSFSGQDALVVTPGGGFATVIGSPTGTNKFYGSLSGTLFKSNSSNNTLSYANLALLAGPVTIDTTSGTVSGSGPSDSFSFPNGLLTLVGSPSADTFIIGTRTVTLQGGGGTDTLDLSHLPAAANVNLPSGSITASGAGGVTFTACTASPTTDQLCVGKVTGTPFNDLFTVSPNGPSLNVLGNGGTDTLDLSQLTTSATINMATGTVSGTSPAITFSGITNVLGTQPGGDTVKAGPGTASFTEVGGAPGTVDFSTLGAPGVQVNVTTTNGTPTGTATNSLATINYAFSGFNTFVGTAFADAFTQNGPGSFNFLGGLGNNTLTLSNLPTNVQVTLSAPDASCGAGTSTSDGTAVLSGSVNDTFSCMYQVSSSGTLVFAVNPGQHTTLNGGGTGTLQLINATAGATIDLLNGVVSGGGYGFSFSGMSTVVGTPFNDLFIAGPGNFTLNGMGGSNGISFANAPNAATVNDSSSSYTIPAGLPGAGTVIPAGTAIGGYGGTLKLIGIANLIASTSNNDILVASPSAPATLIGGAGSDRFVLTGGNDYLYAGTGNSTLDLSLLSGQTSLDLASAAQQPLGSGYLTLGGGSIQTVVASPGGSAIWGGAGTLTLIGGPGADWLAAGSGTQTLVGGGGADTLIGGVGTNTLQGGAQPVTFQPGQGTDTLTSPISGNTLSYNGAPSAVQVNLSTQLFSVPANEPFAGTTLSPQSAIGGWGANVALSNAGISQVIGTSQADILITGPGGTTINGNGGPDLFVILSGNNTLVAAPGSGARFLFDGAGNNSINGGGNGTVDFSQAPAGVNVNLQTGNATGGFGGFQQLAGILNIIGSNFNDVLIAGAPGGTINSLNGNDVLQSGPSGGNTLIGGNGNNTFCAQASCAAPGTVAGGGNVMIGGSGNDYFFARNGALDYIDGGGGFNVAFTDPREQYVANIQQQTVA